MELSTRNAFPNGTGIPWHYYRHNLTKLSKEEPMAQLLESKDVVEFKELLMSNTTQVDTIDRLLIKNGYLTEVEILEKMKQAHADYGRLPAHSHKMAVLL
jgi:hypothetical protein